MIVYHIKSGEPLLFLGEQRKQMHQILEEAAYRYQIPVIELNVLPDHVHLITTSETETELNEYIRKLKGYSAKKFKLDNNLEEGFSVWAQKFNRRVLEDESALTRARHYVRNNHLKHQERWGDLSDE